MKLDVKNKVVVSSLIAVVLVMVLYLNTASIAKSKMLYSVYSTNDCNILQANIASWAVLNDEIEEHDDMKKKIEEVLKQLDIKGKVEVTKNESDEKNEYSATRTTENVKTTIKIETEKIVDKTTLSINIVIYDNINGIGYVQNKLEDIYKKENVEHKMNITLAGNYKEKYDRERYKELATKICKSVKAKKVNEFETEKIYSIYGYTDYIDDHVMVNKKKVNINIALRYNEYEDKTYLYIATPIITTDY